MAETPPSEDGMGFEGLSDPEGAEGTPAAPVAAAAVAVGDEPDTECLLTGTARGWRVGTALGLYGSAKNLDNVAKKRNLSTGERVDYVCVWQLPEEKRPTRKLLEWLKDPSESRDPSDSHQGSARRRRRFLEGLCKTCTVEEEIGEDNRTVYVKVHVPFAMLKQQAEDMHLRLPLDNESPATAASTSIVDRMREAITTPPGFITRWREPDVPEADDYYAGTFQLAHEQNFRHYNHEHKMFKGGYRSLLAFSILQRVRWGNKKYQIGVQRLISEGAFMDAFPLHDGDHLVEIDRDAVGRDGYRRVLYEEWAGFKAFYKIQPLDFIRNYFGEKVGFYFTWLGFYTNWLYAPAAVGMLAFIYGLAGLGNQTDSSDICNTEIVMCPLCDSGCEPWSLNVTCQPYEAAYLFDNGATVAFAFIMAIWSSVFLDFWKRKNISTAYDWDTLDFEENEPARAEFQGTEERADPVTGEIVPYYPPSKRLIKYGVSFAMIFFMITLVIACVVGVIVYRLAVSVLLFESSGPESSTRENATTITSATSAVINLVVIMILNILYGKMAIRLTDWENHRKQSVYERSLAVKMFCFQFVNSYSSLFYIAFFKGQNTGRPGDYNTFLGFRQDECPPYGCLLELTIQLSVIMVGKQFVNNAQEIILPRVKVWLCAGNGDDEQVLPWENQFRTLTPYPKLGLFYEYLEMVIQFGFISLFVAAFPLGPFFALLNNILEIRVDAIKHIHNYRRPPALRAEDVGIWDKAMTFISYLSVLTSGLVIALTSSFVTKEVFRRNNGGSLGGYIDRVYPLSPVTSGLDPSIEDCHYNSLRDADGSRGVFYYEVLAAKLGFVLAFEHVVILIKVLVQAFIPDVPKSVQTSIAREKYFAAQALQATSKEATPLAKLDAGAEVMSV